MGGFREHFFDKYFDYRRRYVDYIVREAPARARLANLSEIARLAFMIAGNLLCASLLWLLVAGAAARPGAAVLTLVFVLLALMPTAFGALAVRGLLRALGDRSRVEEGARHAAKGSGR